MRDLLFHTPLVYLLAFFVCLSLMLLVDYILGSMAEYLNAWDILLRHFLFRSASPPCKVVSNFGLWGATVIVILLNILSGVLSVQLLRLIFRK